MTLFRWLIMIGIGMAGLFFAAKYLKNALEFFNIHAHSDFPFRHTRRNMLFFLLKTWLVIFIAAFFTLNIIMWLGLLGVWGMLGWALFKFSASWKKHDYARWVLLTATALVTVLSFVLSPLLRGLILP